MNVTTSTAGLIPGLDSVASTIVITIVVFVSIVICGIMCCASGCCDKHEDYNNRISYKLVNNK